MPYSQHDVDLSHICITIQYIVGTIKLVFNLLTFLKFLKFCAIHGGFKLRASRSQSRLKTSTRKNANSFMSPKGLRTPIPSPFLLSVTY